MSCDNTDLYKFLVFAKSCGADLACKFVSEKNHGKVSAPTMDKLLLLNSYIREIENYVFSCCKNFVENGIKHLGGKKIIMSSENSLYLVSKEQKIEITSTDLNCLTEDQICKLADNIREVCLNC